MIEDTLLSRLGSFSLLQKNREKIEKSIKKSRRKRKIRTYKTADPLPGNEIKKLVKQLQENTFNFHPYFPKEILKNNTADESQPEKRYRGLSIPSPRDRVVHKTMLHILLPKFLPYISQTPSYGVLKKHGIKEAIRDVQTLVGADHEYLLIADIQRFFNKIDKNLLTQKVLSQLNDRSLDRLIKETIHAKYKTIPKNEILFPGKEIGIPQGCALSPLFSDVYLKEFDLKMTDSGYKIFRYIDDFIIPCKTKRHRYFAYLRAKKILKSMKLNLDAYGKDKCKTTEISNLPVFLGFQLGLNNRIASDPKKYYKFKKKIGQMISDLPQQRHRWSEIIKEINYIIPGWCGAYSICNKAVVQQYCNELNTCITENIEKLKDKKRLSDNDAKFFRHTIKKFRFTIS